MRRMSCSLTTEAVRARTKTVTRRGAWTWTALAPGERLTLVEKAQGLARGQHQVVVAEVEVVSNGLVKLLDITPAEVQAEGFGLLDPAEFVAFWLRSNGLRLGGYGRGRVGPDVMCRRIEWRYLDPGVLCPECSERSLVPVFHPANHPHT